MKCPRYEKASKIGVAVIGYGATCEMGKKHLTCVQELGMTPTAVVDPDVNRLKVAQDDFPGISTYTQIDEMLANASVNMVIIITPHNTHRDIAMQCLEAGKHVVCEKPFAITTEECDELIDEANKRDLMVTTYHNRHWDGVIVEALKKIKEEKAIGNIVRLEAHAGRRPATVNDTWRNSKSMSGGIAYDWGVHFIEYSLQLIDANITEISGYSHKGYWAQQSKWKDDCVEDDCTIIVRFDNGVWLNLSISNIDSLPKGADRGFIEVTGTEGTYIMEPNKERIIRMIDGEQVVENLEAPPNRWDKFYENVLAHLVKGDELVITPEWARRTIHILDLANQSAEQGRSMQPKYK